MILAGAKFGRICQLKLEIGPLSPLNARTLTAPEGLSVEFDINRQSLSSTQTGQFRIFGMRPATRQAVYKDQLDWTQFRAVQFRAGYQTFMPLIFNGTILTAYSDREGAETSTTVDCFDGGYSMTNGYTIQSNAGGAVGQAAEDVIAQLGAGMPGVAGKPVVGSFPVANKRGEVLCGNTWNLIQLKSDGNATISDGVVYALNPTEGLIKGKVVDITTLTTANDDIPVINSATGLLGVPRRTGQIVEWDMVFEPRLTLFQVVSLQSTFNPMYNGIFKVMGFRHHGIISPMVNGPCRTTAWFYAAKAFAA